MRDAAVSPLAGDFLPPVSGISPGIHANEGVRPVLEGPVSSDPDTQEAAESAAVALWQGAGYFSALAVAPATKSLSAATQATQQLVGTATLAGGGTAVVTSKTVWTTSDATKATVSAGGLVTAVAVGTATVTGTFNGRTATCVVTVGA